MRETALAARRTGDQVMAELRRRAGTSVATPSAMTNSAASIGGMPSGA